MSGGGGGVRRGWGGGGGCPTRVPPDAPAPPPPGRPDYKALEVALSDINVAQVDRKDRYFVCCVI